MLSRYKRELQGAWVAFANRYTDGYSNRNVYAYSNGYSDSNGNGYSDGDRNVHAYSHTYAYRDPRDNDPYRERRLRNLRRHDQLHCDPDVRRLGS